MDKQLEKGLWGCVVVVVNGSWSCAYIMFDEMPKRVGKKINRTNGVFGYTGCLFYALLKEQKKDNENDGGKRSHSLSSEVMFPGIRFVYERGGTWVNACYGRCGDFQNLFYVMFTVHQLLYYTLSKRRPVLETNKEKTVIDTIARFAMAQGCYRAFVTPQDTRLSQAAADHL